jgi:hypothetical protein
LLIETSPVAGKGAASAPEARLRRADDLDCHGVASAAGYAEQRPLRAAMLDRFERWLA